MPILYIAATSLNLKRNKELNDCNAHVSMTKWLNACTHWHFMCFDLLLMNLIKIEKWLRSKISHWTHSWACSLAPELSPPMVCKNYDNIVNSVCVIASQPCWISWERNVAGRHSIFKLSCGRGCSNVCDGVHKSAGSMNECLFVWWQMSFSCLSQISSASRFSLLKF